MMEEGILDSGGAYWSIRKCSGFYPDSSLTSFLLVFGGLYVILDIKLGSPTCKTNA